MRIIPGINRAMMSSEKLNLGTYLNVRIAWHPTKSDILAVSYNQVVQVLKRKTKESEKYSTGENEHIDKSNEMKSTSDIQDICFSPDGVHIALAINDEVHIWNIETKQV
jgi:WD40 repeat protein